MLVGVGVTGERVGFAIGDTDGEDVEGAEVGGDVGEGVGKLDVGMPVGLVDDGDTVGLVDEGDCVWRDVGKDVGLLVLVDLVDWMVEGARVEGGGVGQK